MKSLSFRVGRLEGKGGSDYANLSDEELVARILAAKGQVEGLGFPLPPDWGSAWAGGNPHVVHQMVERLRCEVMTLE